MSHTDEQLSHLLKRWRDIEPRGNFEANVLRRIRQSAPAAWPTVSDWLRLWLPQPALALTAAVVVGVAVGASSGLLSVAPAPATEHLSFLAPATLAGAIQGNP